MKALSKKSQWSAAQATLFLESFEGPLRIATITASGFPLICSLWYQYEGEHLVCATQKNAALTRHLERDERCAFELSPNEPPYCGLRGQGLAKVVSDGGAEVLQKVSSRYLGEGDTPFKRWLLERAADEVLIQIEPTWITTWDYRQRMSS